MSKSTDSGPFYYLKLINKADKSDIVVGKDYSQYLINRALSLHIDTLAIVNEINMYGQIDDQMHFDYLRHIVDSRPRFAKWPKPKDHKEAKLLSEYYNISMTKAYDLVPIFSQETLNRIEQQLKVE